MTLNEFLESSRMKTAFKTVLAGFVCVLIGEFFHLDGLYFSILLTYLLMTMYKGQVFSAGIKVIITTLLIGFLSVLIALLFYDSKLLYLILSCSLIFLAVLFVPVLNIGAIIGGIVASVILFFTTFNGLNASTETYYILCTQFFVSFAVSSFVDRFVLPVQSFESLKLTVDSTFMSLASQFQNLNNQLKNRPNTENELNLDTFKHIGDLIRLSDKENIENYRHDLQVKVAVFAKEIYIKCELIRNILSEENSLWLKADVSEIIEHLNSNASEALNYIHDSWITGSTSDFYITKVYTEDMEKDVLQLENRYTELHDKKSEEAYYYEKLLSFGSLITLYKIVILKLNKINSVQNEINNAREAFYSPKDLSLEKSMNLSTDYGHVILNLGNIKQGIKIVIITLILFFGELYLKLPGGFQVTFYSILFGLLPNIGQVHQKAKMAIGGVFISVLYGFICYVLLSQVQNFVILSLLFILGSFIFSFLANGTGSASYGWFHALLIVPYALLVSDVGVVDDLYSAAQRAMALIVVSCVGLLVQHYIWPVIPERQLRYSIKKSIQTTGLILEELLKMDISRNEEVKKLVKQQSNALPTINTLFNDAKYLVNTEDENTVEYMKIIERVEFLYIQAESLYVSIFESLDNKLLPLYLSHMKENYDELISVIQNVADQFESNNISGYDFEKLTEDFINHRQKFRDSDIWRKFSVNEIENSVLIAKTIDDLLDSIMKINLSVNIINSAEETSSAFEYPAGAEV